MEPFWYVTKDGDVSCLELYERHYSCNHYADGRKRTQCVGPGEHIMLRTGDADAMFVWRNYIDDTEPKQEGVECAIFRNEAPDRYLSSELVRQADAVADFCWPGERHYTYVRAQAIRSSNPGFCFVAAGWRRCGTTKGGLFIFERRRPSTHPTQLEPDMPRRTLRDFMVENAPDYPPEYAQACQDLAEVADATKGPDRAPEHSVDAPEAVAMRERARVELGKVAEQMKRLEGKGDRQDRAKRPA